MYINIVYAGKELLTQEFWQRNNNNTTKALLDVNISHEMMNAVCGVCRFRHVCHEPFVCLVYIWTQIYMYLS